MSKQKTLLLGENFSTASGKLRKAILFDLVQRLALDNCYRCTLKIDSIKDLSIEHKESWQSAENPIDSFYSIENIGFSHLKCNVGAANRMRPMTSTHGSRARYKQGCKCIDCLRSNSSYIATRRLITGKH